MLQDFVLFANIIAGQEDKSKSYLDTGKLLLLRLGHALFLECLSACMLLFLQIEEFLIIAHGKYTNNWWEISRGDLDFSSGPA